jgi:hypothetical protein
MIYIGTTDVFKLRMGSWKAAATITGPNHHPDVSPASSTFETAVARAATTLAPSPPPPPRQGRDEGSRPACLELLKVCLYIYIS